MAGPYGARRTPASVTIVVTSSAGVTSKDGLRAGAPAGAILLPPSEVTSAALRISTVIREPSAASPSSVAVGATTWKGTPWRAASTASG
jgi:hypothetical protein